MSKKNETLIPGAIAVGILALGLIVWRICVLLDEMIEAKSLERLYVARRLEAWDAANKKD